MAAQPTFGTSNLMQCSTELRTIGDGATSMEEVASAVVGYLRVHFVDKGTGVSALPLARFYVTQRCDELEPGLQDFARAAATDPFAGPRVLCLTLLGTAGEEPARTRRES